MITDKSKEMVYRNGAPLRHYELWYFKGTKLEVVSNYKCMGLYFTPKLCWSFIRTTLANQASKAVFCIMKQQRYFGSFSTKDAFKLFDMIVRPILCYGAEIWGYQYSAAIEKVHTDFCRRICGLNQNVVKIYPLCECGRAPMSVHYMTKCVRYWIKLLQMPNERYPRQCYLMLRRLDESGRKTFVT